MSFIKFIPYGTKTPSDLWTTCESNVQIWQELTMLRHISGQNAIYAKETTSSYIEQAKVYFLDAAKSNWRSAGLLYYYSFLNLAKAHLVTNRAVSGRTLKSTSIYHGLTAAPQRPANIINFQIEIHPPGQNNRRNIFSHFYQKLIGEAWPFNNNISITIEDIVPYCDDISHEIANFYNIERDIIDIYSFARKNNNRWWLEIMVPDFKIPMIQRDIGPFINSVINYAAMTPVDKHEWLVAHNITASRLQNHSLIRVNEVVFTNANENAQYMRLVNDTIGHFNGLILPPTFHNFDSSPHWNFIPKITLNGRTIKWHPLLSNYLFAFMLSSILRYQPHLFSPNSKDSFIAEAWCNQSASASLRYFLMELTRQNIRINI
jgi:hypothetical protein